VCLEGELRGHEFAGLADQTLSTPLLADYVPAGEEERELAPNVLQARDERLLNEAQVAAEAYAQRDDYANAARVLAEAMGRLSSPELVAFANEVLMPSYQHERAYLAASSVRASTDKALKKRRMPAANQVVVERLGGLAQSASGLAPAGSCDSRRARAAPRAGRERR
jgi:hypothetical protein